MRTSNAGRLQAIIPILILVLTAGTANAAWFGDYFRLIVGSTWEYEEDGNPGVLRVETVSEIFEYEGDDVVRFGELPDDYAVVQSDARTVTVYAQTDDQGVLVDFPNNIVLAEFADGDDFVICPTGVDCDTSLIRVWTELDPSLRSIYGIEAQPWGLDLMLIASYDRDYPKNLNNTAIESNLPAGVEPPAGAVTGVEWYMLHNNLYAELDVDAASGGFGEFWRLVSFPYGATGVSGVEETPPSPVRLDQNAPNPFNPSTRIGFALAADLPVTLTVHDARGRHVRTLARDWRPGAGEHGLEWGGRDAGGRAAPAGVYFYRLVAGDECSTRSMTLVR